MGAIRNAEIAKDLFPDWQFWVYVSDVDANVAKQIKLHRGVVVYVNSTTVELTGFGMK